MSAMPEFVPYQTSESYTEPRRSGSVASPIRARRYQSGVRPERYVATIGMTVGAVIGMMVWIGGYVQVTVQGYHIDGLQRELAGVQQANRQLEAQSALLGAPGRVIPAAQQLSMEPAAPSRTVNLPASASTAAQPEPASTALAMVPSP